MSSLDELFYKEFTQTMRARASFKPLDITKVPIPSFKADLVKADKVIVRGIKDEYYSKLNGKECILWSRPKLRRRRFDSTGNFLKNANGEQLYTEVPVPRSCIAILSEERLGVPLKHKPKEVLDYVDFIVNNNTKTVYYIYIVPRVNCFMLNQTALVMSVRPLRSFYDGLSLYLTNGHTVYIYVVPYKPKGAVKPYKVLATKSTLNYKEEIGVLMQSFESLGVIFPRSLTVLGEPVKGRINMGYQVLNSTLDDFVQFDYSKSLADTNDDIEVLLD